MPIHVRCPKPDCGQMLSVRDEFAGKTGKCPKCGTPIKIPAAPGAEPLVTAAPAIPRPAAEEGEIPVRKGPARRREEDYDDYEEERVPVRRGKPTKTPSRVGTLVCLGIGIGLLIILSLIPFFSMYSLAAGGRAGMAVHLSSGGMFQMWEGKIMFIVTLLVALLIGTGLILYLTLTNPRLADLFANLSVCVAGGWGLVMLLWIIAFVWDILAVNRSLAAMGAGEGEGISPGFGLWLGLVLALGVVAVFSTLAGMRGLTLWLYVGEGAGLLLGILLLVVDVQPWDTGSTDRFGPRGSNKFIKRYAPLMGAPNFR